MSTKYYSGVVIAVMAVLLFASAPLSASQPAKTIQVSGEIEWVDIALGRLQLKPDATRNRRDPIEYRINQNDTRVTDPADKKFLKLKDLQAGQSVVIKFDYVRGKWIQVPIAKKIIVSPVSSSVVTKSLPKGSASTVTTTTTKTTTSQ